MRLRVGGNRDASSLVLGVLLTVWTVGLCPPAAFGQIAGSERPFRSLFGGATSDAASSQALDFTSSVFGGYDDDIFARGAGPTPGRQRLGGGFAGIQAALRYAKQYPTATLTAGVLSSLRWLAQNGEFVPTMYGGSVEYAKQLGPRTSLRLSQGAAYQPRFMLAPFLTPSTLGPTVVDDLGSVDLETDGVIGSGSPDDFAIVATRNAMLYSGRASVARALTSRSSLSAFGSYSMTDFRNDQYVGVSSRRYRIGGLYTYSLTRHLSARLGYGYRSFRTRDGSPTEAHDIDVGVNYARPFTVGFGRDRTRLVFTTGTAAIVRDRRDLDGESRGGRRLLLRGVGTATLLHQFVAPWQAQVRYQRVVGFIDGHRDIFSGDQTTAALGGLLGRRTDLMMSVGYLSGAIGLRERNFKTTLGTVRARFALTPGSALFAQYTYYKYDYAEPVVQALGLPPSLERQGVRAGLTLWLPLVR